MTRVLFLKWTIALVILWFCFVGVCCLLNSPYREARDYLEQTIPTVVKHWNVDDLRKNSDPALLEHIDSSTGVRSLFARCSKELGALKSIGKSKIRDGGVFCGKAGCTFVYECITPATFEKGTAKIVTEIHFHHGVGRIESFVIE
jgi:hypothetical protein